MSRYLQKGLKMIENKHFFALLIIFVAFIFGCSAVFGNYGRIKDLPRTKDQVTIQHLIDTWKDYDVYYAGLYVKSPLGIMFDPKNNNTTLKGDRWKKVEDQKTLNTINSWLHVNNDYEPKLREILGPDGKFYGYLYHSEGPAVFKQIDDGTLYAYDLEEPCGGGYSNCRGR
jgi:hypothetical protein